MFKYTSYYTGINVKQFLLQSIDQTPDASTFISIVVHNIGFALSACKVQNLDRRYQHSRRRKLLSFLMICGQVVIDLQGFFVPFTTISVENVSPAEALWIVW